MSTYVTSKNRDTSTLKGSASRDKLEAIMTAISSATSTLLTLVAATITGAFTMNGSLLTPVTTVAAATYDLLVTDLLVHVTYTGTWAVTSLTLPTAQVSNGRRVIVKDAGGGATANNITIDTEGSETIDGAATLVIAVDYGYAELYSDGTNWFVLGQRIA
jgi:hypothetical protein